MRKIKIKLKSKKWHRRRNKTKRLDKKLNLALKRAWAEGNKSRYELLLAVKEFGES